MRLKNGLRKKTIKTILLIMNDKEKIKEAVKLIDELIDNMSEKQRLAKELNQKVMDEVTTLAKLKDLLTHPFYDDKF